MRKKLTVTEYKVKTDRISGRVRVVFLSDLHSTEYGCGQADLLSAVVALSPDIVLLGGDMIDNRYSTAPAVTLISEINRRFRCFYVSGNHEFYDRLWKRNSALLAEAGITPLDGDTVTVSLGEDRVHISGLHDYYMHTPDGDPHAPANAEWRGRLAEMAAKKPRDGLRLLLSHRPEMTEDYSSAGYDMVFCGHAHGGQIRGIPFFKNGVFAPGQGLSPKYTKGIYDIGESRMVVSSGLCVNFLPRWFNPPEIVVVEFVG